MPQVEFFTKTTRTGEIYADNQFVGLYRTIYVGKFNNEPRYQVYKIVSANIANPNDNGFILEDSEEILFTSEAQLEFILKHEIEKYLAALQPAPVAIETPAAADGVSNSVIPDAPQHLTELETLRAENAALKAQQIADHAEFNECESRRLTLEIQIDDVSLKNTRLARENFQLQAAMREKDAALEALMVERNALRDALKVGLDALQHIYRGSSFPHTKMSNAIEFIIAALEVE